MTPSALSLWTHNVRGLVSAIGISLLLAACDSGVSSEPATGGNADTMSGKVAAAPPTPAKALSKPGKQRGPDIGGIFLGMTPEQVQAAFAADQAPTKTQVMEKTIRYSVLGKAMKTEPFLSTLIAQYREPHGRVMLEAGVAPAPSEPRVISVRRTHTQDLQRLPRSDYRATLIKKYGNPTYEEEVQDVVGVSSLEMTWLLSDGVQCVKSAANAAHVGEPVQKSFRTPQGAMRNPDARSDEDCANFLVYTLREDPVRLATGVLWDVKADLAAQAANEQWVAQKQAEASKPGTAAPKL